MGEGKASLYPYKKMDLGGEGPGVEEEGRLVYILTEIWIFNYGRIHSSLVFFPVEPVNKQR